MLCANVLKLGLISGSKQEDENVKCLRKQQRHNFYLGFWHLGAYNYTDVHNQIYSLINNALFKQI